MEKHKGGLSSNKPPEEIMMSRRLEQDTIWLDLSECILKGDLGFLKHGVVGSWKTQPASDPLVTEVEA